MIKPYTERGRPKPMHIGLLSSTGKVPTVMGEDGTFPLERTPDKTVIYARKSDAERWFLRGMGPVVVYNDNPVRWEGPHPVVILRDDWGAEPDEIMTGLCNWRDWLESFGARPASVGGGANSLLRATLSRPLGYAFGDRPPLPELIGGRRAQSRPAGTYPECEIWDISGAYGSTLGALNWSGAWRVLRTTSLPATPRPCFVSAEVRFPPGLVWGPLPRRYRSREPRSTVRSLDQRPYPGGLFGGGASRTVAGVWTREEIEAAREVGAKVKIRRVWLLSGPSWHPFEPFWDACMIGRRMPGIAGSLAKATGNALWSRFSMGGERERWTFARNEVKREEYPLPRLPDGTALSETVSGRVRARLYTEVLAPHGTFVWAANTDGAIVGRGLTPHGENWRVTSARSLVLLTPQIYMYRNAGDGKPVYKVSGVPRSSAERTFWALAGVLIGQERAVRLPRLRPSAIVLQKAFPELSMREAKKQVQDWFGKEGPGELEELKSVLEGGAK